MTSRFSEFEALPDEGPSPRLSPLAWLLLARIDAGLSGPALRVWFRENVTELEPDAIDLATIELLTLGLIEKIPSYE